MRGRGVWLRALVAIGSGLCWLLVACDGREEAAGGAGATTASPGNPAGPSEGRVDEPTAVPVTTWLTTARDVVDRASLPADLRPMRRAVLAAEVAGTVEKLRVDEGDAVGKGKVLLTIESRAAEQRLAEAEAVERHRLELFRRAEKLLARKSITEQQYLDAVTERDVAEAQLAAAQLVVEKSGLTAPWAGTVAVRRVEVGDYVVPGQAVIELLEVRRLKVRAPAPATEIPNLRLGLPAEVRLDIYPDEVFHGAVTFLATELDPAARTLDVEVQIDNADGKLRPGMYARLEIPRRTLSAAILVPLAAIVELENSQVVYVVEDGLAVRRSVELGSVIGDEVVVSSGLVVGEQLIIEGQRRVGPGQPVTVTQP